MAPNASSTKPAALTKKPEKEKKSATPYADNLREQGIKPDILDYPAMAWEATINAVSKVITKMKPKKKKEAESHPAPRLKDKGKPHENYDRPERELSLQSVRSGVQ